MKPDNQPQPSALPVKEGEDAILKLADAALTENKANPNHITKQLNQAESISYHTGFFTGYVQGHRTASEQQDEKKTMQAAIDRASRIMDEKDKEIAELRDAIKSRNILQEEDKAEIKRLKEILSVANSYINASYKFHSVEAQILWVKYLQLTGNGDAQ